MTALANQSITINRDLSVGGALSWSALRDGANVLLVVVVLLISLVRGAAMEPAC